MKGKLTVLMITAFVDMLGLAMVIPLLPFYATKLGASATIVGVLIAAFSIAQRERAPLGPILGSLWATARLARGPADFGGRVCNLRLRDHALAPSALPNRAGSWR